MIVIPAIDVIEGKCVRLTQGDYNQKKSYYDHPLEVAKKFEDHGCKRLHLVDLDGAKQKKVINHKVLEEICSKTSLVVDFGGGVQTDEDLRIAFDCGASLITAGSIAVKNKALVEDWLKKHSGEKIILGADVKEKKIAIHGWQEKSDIHLFDLIEEFLALGVKYSICTDVSKDGLLQGPSTDLYIEINERFPSLQLVASGGVSGMEDIETLQAINVYGVIVGKAIYEERIKLEDLKPYW